MFLSVLIALLISVRYIDIHRVKSITGIISGAVCAVCSDRQGTDNNRLYAVIVSFIIPLLISVRHINSHRRKSHIPLSLFSV